jgi:hypothetical protein
MSNAIRYADLWALLRKLGFDCDTLDEQNHRVCEFAPTDTRIVLHDYAPDQPVREEILIGVRLQLDNGGVMSRADFDRWAARQAKVNTPVDINGGARRRKTRKDISPPR